jgi:hypothetical protein
VKVNMTREYTEGKPRRSLDKLRSRSIRMSVPWEMLEPMASLDVLTVQSQRLYLLVSPHPMSRARSVSLKPYYGSGVMEDAEAMLAREMGEVVLVADCRKAGIEERVVQEVAKLCCATSAESDGFGNVLGLLSKISSDVACPHLRQDSKALWMVRCYPLHRPNLRRTKQASCSASSAIETHRRPARRRLRRPGVQSDSGGRDWV